MSSFIPVYYVYSERRGEKEEGRGREQETERGERGGEREIVRWGERERE